MKNLTEFINETVSMSVISKTVKVIKKENPNITPEELRDKVYSTIGSEAIGSNKRLTDYVDQQAGIKK